MIVKRFKDFIFEKISIVNTDSPSIISSANSLNDLESHIKEFNMKKVEIENIYKTAENETNLIDNLKSRGYINPTTNKSQMEFKNPLLGKYASVCDLKKKVSDLEKEQGEVDNSIKDKESQIGTNPTLKDSITQDIGTKRTDIENIKKRIQEIKAESDRLERLTMKELQEMQKEIVSGTRDVRQARSKT
jgi:chromosome segregation ATPase